MSETEKSPEQVEKEQMTRRQALRKFGFGAGLSAFMLLGVDDLARMVGNKMQQMDGDNKVANQVAREFQSAGVAFAAGGPSYGCSSKSTWEDCDQCCQDACGGAQGCTDNCEGPNGANCGAKGG